MQRPQKVTIQDIYAVKLITINSCTIYLYVANDPIIESSSDLKFAPFNVAYPLLDQQVQSVGFDVSKYLSKVNQVIMVIYVDVNKWDMIFDFTKDEQKLNYSFVDPADFQIVSKSIEGVEEKPA